MRSIFSLRLLLAPAAILLAACGNDATSPASVTGEYTAVTFKIVQLADTTDVLAAGGSLSITLFADGTNTGQLVIPAALNGGNEFTASMDGTYTLQNGVLTFTQAADTFVRNMHFAVSGKQLRGSDDFTGTRIILVLERP